MENKIIPICTGCQKYPKDIPEYVEAAEEEETDPDKYVELYEGTYNNTNGHFLCTDCYVAAGMPSKSYPGRWVAP